MIEPRASSQIRRKLMQEAAKSSRPAIRTGTIERLVEACDVIESGTAVELIQEYLGGTSGIARHRLINPSNVERVVLAKRAKGHPGWTGPKRVTIQNDPDLKLYVEARENERVKMHMPKSPSSRRHRLQEAIDSIPDSIQRDFVRGELAVLHQVRNENDVLTHVLKNLEPVKYETLRNTNAHLADLGTDNHKDRKHEEDAHQNLTKYIERLLRRLEDEQQLSTMGMELYRGRIRHKKTGRQLIAKDELISLRKLVGYIIS